MVNGVEWERQPRQNKTKNLGQPTPHLLETMNMWWGAGSPRLISSYRNAWKQEETDWSRNTMLCTLPDEVLLRHKSRCTFVMDMLLLILGDMCCWTEAA